MDYHRIAKSTQQKIAKYGRTVVLRQEAIAGGGYNPATQTVKSNPTPTLQNRKALIMDAPGSNIGRNYGNTTNSGTLIQGAEKWIYMDALGLKPRAKDTVTWDGFPYKVLDCQELSPGGVVLFYMLVLGR